MIYNLSMRIVTWNCNRGRIEKKFPHLKRLKYDIAIIQEASKPKQGTFKEGHYLWFGHNENQGVLVISGNNYQLSSSYTLHKDLRYFIPVKVSGSMSFNLVAVWVKPTDRYPGYMDGLDAACTHLSRFIKSAPTIMAGDFNTCASFSGDGMNIFHDRLYGEMRLFSAYHYFNHDTWKGKERDQTFHLYRHRERGFHLDYAFIPQSWALRLKSVQVGSFREWKALSDHRPVIVDLTDKRPFVAPSHKDVPNGSQYVRAFRGLIRENKLTNTQRKMLSIHLRSPHRTITASEMARRMGWKKFTAANAKYGRLGRLLQDAMEYSNPYIPTSTLAVFDHDPDSKEWRWILRDEVVHAMKILALTSLRHELK